MGMATGGGAQQGPFSQPFQMPDLSMFGSPAKSWTDQGTTAQAQGGTAFSNPPSQPPQSAGPVSPSQAQPQAGPVQQPGTMLGTPEQNPMTGRYDESLNEGTQPNPGQPFNMMNQPATMPDQPQLTDFASQMGGLPAQTAGPVAPQRDMGSRGGVYGGPTVQPGQQQATFGAGLNTPQAGLQGPQRRDMGSRGGRVAGGPTTRLGQPQPTFGAGLRTPRPFNPQQRDMGSQTNRLMGGNVNRVGGGGGGIGSLLGTGLSALGKLF